MKMNTKPQEFRLQKTSRLQPAGERFVGMHGFYCMIQKLTRSESKEIHGLSACFRHILTATLAAGTK